MGCILYAQEGSGRGAAMGSRCVAEVMYKCVHHLMSFPPVFSHSQDTTFRQLIKVHQYTALVFAPRG